MQVLITIVIVVLIIVLFISCIKIVPQATAMVVEWLGKYQATWPAGAHFLVPFFNRVAKRVNLKEQVADFPPQPVITKDNVTMRIDSVVFFYILDPKLYAYGVENPIAAIENLTATCLRNIIGSMDLDTTLTSRDTINMEMEQQLEEATDPWGIKVTRVEIKNIMPPDPIREAMEKQMMAERNKRAVITEAEGIKASAITKAEGNKQAMILNAEAEKERRIREAEGQAQAIQEVKKAEAEGIRMLKEAGADDAVVKLKSLDTLAQVANGQSVKIIVPSDIQNMAGLLTALKESVNDPAGKGETQP